jgi:hypothetical protein
VPIESNTANQSENNFESVEILLDSQPHLVGAPRLWMHDPCRLQTIEYPGSRDLSSCPISAKADFQHIQQGFAVGMREVALDRELVSQDLDLTLY